MTSMAPKKKTPQPAAKKQTATPAKGNSASSAKSKAATISAKSKPVPSPKKSKPEAKAEPKGKAKANPKPKQPKPQIVAPKSIKDQILATLATGNPPKVAHEQAESTITAESGNQPQAESEILQISRSVEVTLEADEPVGGSSAEILDVGEQQALQDPRELESAIEAILFASPEPIPVKKIVDALEGPEAKVVKEALERLNKFYEERRGGMQVVEVQGGWRMGTHERHSEIIYRLGSRKKRQALSPATLETLAIIAYRQPIIRAQIETIRGVECSGTIRNLLDLGLIEITGYKEVIGRPALYGTTPRFLTTFGLRSLTDLPSIRGLKEQLKQKEAEEAQREMEARAKSEAEARAQVEAASQAMADAGIIAAEPEESDGDEDDALEGEVLGQAEGMAGENADDTEDYEDEDDGDEYDDDDEDEDPDEEDSEDDEEDDEEDEFDEDEDDDDEEDDEEDDDEDDDDE